MASISKPLGGQVISIGSTGSGSGSGSIVRRSQLGPGANGQTPLGAVVPGQRGSFITPPGSENKPSGFTVASPGPARVQVPSAGIILRRSSLGEPDTND